MSADRTPTNTRRPNYLVAAAPFLWAVLILFHPMPGGDNTLDGIDDVVDRWLIVHVAQLILTPLLFLAVWRLLDGLSSPAATISRCALVVWTVFFSAYDAVQGIATGLLVRHAGGVPTAQQNAIAEALDYLVLDSRLAGDISAVQMVAGAAWLTVAIGAAIALHQARAGTTVVALTAISVVFSMHMAPAAIGLLALTGAVVLREHQRATSPAASALTTPFTTESGQPPTTTSPQLQARR
ncbi:MAG: hypothetical protein ABWY30_01810 [Microterricola sp.]